MINIDATAPAVVGATGVVQGKYPKTIQTFKPAKFFGGIKHPTQKPVALMEYLIRTYTQEGETVLDFAMGSGTTGVACAKLGRKFIGIELEPKYFEISCERIQKAYDQPDLFVEPPKKAEQENIDFDEPTT